MINEEQLFKHMHFVRSITLKALEATTEKLADEIPSGFKNSIRWNLGHIYVIHEFLAYYFSGGNPSIPTNYEKLFHRATSPTNWGILPPRLEELSEHLAKQTIRIEDDFRGRLSEETSKFEPRQDISYSSIGELLNFATFHEGNHIGSIKAIKRACGIKQLWDIPDE